MLRDFGLVLEVLEAAGGTGRRTPNRGPGADGG